ncbi:hypothetical protein R3P38DRAFT_3179954 [Favolaschia claudopus]|uniref:Uncharacterized protein n=1 Tax=Favolaschia claudopus TaxID=2862362 RepID=A0AAW0CRL9_9AGAR
MMWTGHPGPALRGARLGDVPEHPRTLPRHPRLASGDSPVFGLALSKISPSPSSKHYLTPSLLGNIKWHHFSATSHCPSRLLPPHRTPSLQLKLSEADPVLTWTLRHGASSVEGEGPVPLIPCLHTIGTSSRRRHPKRHLMRHSPLLCFGFWSSMDCL